MQSTMLTRDSPPTAFVSPCGGASPNGRLAGAVARELARRGLAEHPPAGLAWAHPPTRPVLAIDGCAYACATRTLEAQGVRPLASVRVEHGPRTSADRKRATVERAIRRLGSAESHDAATRGFEADERSRARPGRRAAVYLGALAALSECKGGADEATAPVSPAELARLFGIARTSAGEVIARLERDGLVGRTRDRQIVLTPAGRRAGERSRRLLALAERFLTEYLGCDEEEVREHAHVLAAKLDDEMAARLERALGTWGDVARV